MLVNYEIIANRFRRISIDSDFCPNTFLWCDKWIYWSCARGGYFLFYSIIEKMRNLLKKYEFFNEPTILMNLRGPHLSNTSTDSILLLHMERTYIGCVQRQLFLIFHENWKIAKTVKKLDMFHLDFHDYKFVLPQCLTAFSNAIKWQWFVFIQLYTMIVRSFFGGRLCQFHRHSCLFFI